MIEIRWHGRGGQGAFTASKILGAAAVLDGNYALAFPSFGPERRGAPIQAFTKISQETISDRTVIKKCDYIIYLDETLYQEDAIGDLKEGGHILINSKTPARYPQSCIDTIDADTISEQILHRTVSNTVMLAALAAGFAVTEETQIKKALGYYLSEKVAEKNRQVVDYVTELWKKERGASNV